MELELFPGRQKGYFKGDCSGETTLSGASRQVITPSDLVEKTIMLAKVEASRKRGGPNREGGLTQ